MNLLWLLVGGIVIFLLASRFYSRVIARNLGLEPSRSTPSTTINDGRDFVPTRIHVLFAHHFSTIAGAGPILGPTMVLLFGFGPAWLWIVFGCVFLGAVHDFSALFVSIREGGRSIAEVSRSTLGQFSFILFILFTIVLLVLVTSNFLAATAISLTSQWPIEKLGLADGQTFLRTVSGQNGQTLGVIGGIASTSVIIITLLSPLLGYLLYRRGIRTTVAYPLASIICLGSVAVGVYFPLSLNPKVWMVVLSVYVMLAAALPVWVILQPRDFINVQLLYIGLAALAVGVVLAGLGGSVMHFPAFRLDEGAAKLGTLWPMLFITVACGAISGFHSLVAGGTTAKQVASEKDVKRIGYDGMLLEGVLALLVVLALGSTLTYQDYMQIVWPSSPDAKSNPILAFSLAVGHLLNQTMGIPQALATVFGILLVEGFVITTLDSAVRLNRYLFEELWASLWGGVQKVPRILRNANVNAGIAVALMCLLAFTNSFSVLWPLFGTSNQLLAALTLIVVSAWLLKRGRRAVYTIIPGLFVLVTTIASLWLLFEKYLATRNWLLLGADAFLMLLAGAAVGTTVLSFKDIIRGAGKGHSGE